MPIKNLIARGIGYSPGGTYYQFTSGFDAGPGSVTPFVPGPNHGLFKKSGAGSLLKVGSHLVKDTDCCCHSYDEACFGRTGKKITGITADITWTDATGCGCNTYRPGFVELN